MRLLPLFDAALLTATLGCLGWLGYNSVRDGMHAPVERTINDATASVTPFPGSEAGPGRAFKQILTEGEACRRYGPSGADILYHDHPVHDFGATSRPAMTDVNRRIGRALGCDATSFKALFLKASIAVSTSNGLNQTPLDPQWSQDPLEMPYTDCTHRFIYDNNLRGSSIYYFRCRDLIRMTNF